MRILFHRKILCKSIICISALYIFYFQSAYSQAVIIHSSNLNEDINVGAPITYCIKILKDTLTGISPTGKSFGILGYPYPVVVTDPDPPGLVNERIGGVFTGRAFLDLTVVPANFELLYHTEARRWPVIIKDPDVVTLDPFPRPYCANEPPFFLTEGNPEGGYYTVNGIVATSFNPSTAGPGTYYIYYLTGTGGCLASSPLQTITVIPVPDVSIVPISDVCADTPPFTLNQGTPAGGTYGGPGITGSVFYPSSAGVGTHTISYTYTNGICQKTAYGTITVSAIPVAGFTGLDSVYCDTDPPVTLTGTPSGGIFTGPGITMSGPGTAIFDPSKTGLGIHSVTYRFTNATGCTNAYTRMVRVGTLLTITGIDPMYCQSSPAVTFNYYPPGGYFSTMPGLTINSNGTASFNPAVSGAGTFNLSYFYNDIWGCINHIVQPVEIAATPFVNFVGLDPDFCANDSPVTLTGNHIPGGTFTGPGVTDNGNGTAIFNPAIIPPGGPYNITYSYIDPATGCGSSKTISTLVMALPTASISGNQSICFGKSAELTVYFTGIGPFNFICTDSHAEMTFNAVSNPYTFTVSPSATTAYTIKSVIGGSGCLNSGEGTATITVNSPVVAEAGENLFLCSDSARLAAILPPGGSGRWSVSRGSAVFTDNTMFNTYVRNLGKGENKLVWTVTVSECSSTDTLIVINNLPSAPGAGPDLDLCSDRLFLAANEPLIGSGSWSIISGSGIFDDISSSTTGVTLGKGTNLLRWTIINGSCILFDEVTIINSLPTVAYAGEDRVICSPVASLLATVPVAGTGSWSLVSGYGEFTDSIKYDTQVSGLGFGRNTLRWTTDNGKCKTYDDVIITNNLAEVYAGPDQVVYSPSVKLIGNRPPAGITEWSLIAGSGLIADQSGFETNVTGLGEGVNSFTWTIENNGCIASDDVFITYKVLPVADFSFIPETGCAPVTINFINNSLGGTPFTWDFGDGSSSGLTNASHTYNIAGTYTVRLTATGPDGMNVRKDSILIIHPVPVAQFQVSPDTAYIPGNSVKFFNLSGSIDSLQWNFGDGAVSSEMNPAHKYESTGSYDVSLSVWSGNNCFDSLLIYRAVYIERAGILTCPNAFTPNRNGPSGGMFNQNDFTNDVFHCFAEGITEYHLQIFNRQGIILFKSDNVNIGWDGYFDSRLVTEGVYVYKVNGRFNNGEAFSRVGNVVVIN